MRPVQRFLFLFVLQYCAIPALQAQVFGGFTPQTRWQQIEAAHAKVIFRLGNDSSAQRVAAVLDKIQKAPGQTLPPPVRPIPLVLQDQTTIPNGYVALGPYRSEFFQIPPQNPFSLGSLRWIDQLALHEYRHVQQYAHFNRGFSKGMGWLFGEQGRALGNALTVPDWFFEGDAIWQETWLSDQGRGRLPYFFNGYRSLWESGRDYHWMKLRNGSLRDYVPDHYQLGYLLTAVGYQRQGDEFWKSVTADAAAAKRGFYPFQKSLKASTGIPYQKWVREALTEARKQLLPVQVDSPKGTAHFEGDQSFPQVGPEEQVWMVESSYDEIPRFVEQRGSMQRRIRAKDVSLDDYFQVRGHQALYASYRPDIRWGYTNYSELQQLDLLTGKQKTLTRKTYFFAPAWDAMRQRIVVAESAPRARQHLCILDSAGTLLQRIPNPSQYSFHYPQFLPDGNLVSVVRGLDGKMAILQTDPVRNSYVALVPFVAQVIGVLQVVSDTLLFTASYRGRDQLFGFTHSDGKIWLLQHPQGNTGDYQPFLTHTDLYFSRFTSTGMRLQKIARTEIQWIDVSRSFLSSKTEAFGWASPTGEPNFLNAIPDTNYAVTPYRKSTKLFNFHSWQPTLDDPNFTFSLLGENVLNTFQSELFLRYNRNEQFTQLGFNGIYGGLFPWIQVGTDFTFNRTGFLRTDTVVRRVEWNEWNSRLGFTIPLNLSKGRSITQLRAGAQWVYAQPYFRGEFKSLLGDRNYSYWQPQIFFSHQIQRARKQIFPRWAQTLQVLAQQMTQRYEGYQWLVSASGYFPGLGRNQHLVLQGAWQDRDQRVRPAFANSFPFSRGYQAANLTDMRKWGINYHFPVAYPDAGLGSVVYLMRIRANLYYDDTRATVRYTGGRQAVTPFRTVGMEWYADTKWWNQLPVSLGLRYAYLVDEDLFGGNGQHRFELVLPVNLLSR